MDVRPEWEPDGLRYDYQAGVVKCWAVHFQCKLITKRVKLNDLEITSQLFHDATFYI